MKKCVCSLLLSILLCGGTIHVMERFPTSDPSSEGGEAVGSGSEGDGCTESGDGGEF
jgi:hypothetical protein